MFLKVEINQEECTACGLCYNEECPAVFKEGSDALAEVSDKYVVGEPTEGAVPMELRSCVEAAAQQCPTNAIKFMELDEMPQDEVVGY